MNYCIAKSLTSLFYILQEYEELKMSSTIFFSLHKKCLLHLFSAKINSFYNSRNHIILYLPLTLKLLVQLTKVKYLSSNLCCSVQVQVENEVVKASE